MTAEVPQTPQAERQQLVRDVEAENGGPIGTLDTARLILAQAYPELTAPLHDSYALGQVAGSGATRSQVSVRQYSSLAPVPHS